MRLRNGSKVRSVDDQRAILFDHRAQSVACFAANPEIFIVIVEYSNHSLVLSPCVFDVHISTYFSSFCEQLAENTHKKARAFGADRYCGVTTEQSEITRDGPKSAAASNR